METSTSNPLLSLLLSKKNSKAADKKLPPVSSTSSDEEYEEEEDEEEEEEEVFSNIQVKDEMVDDTVEEEEKEERDIKPDLTKLLKGAPEVPGFVESTKRKRERKSSAPRKRPSASATTTTTTTVKKEASDVKRRTNANKVMYRNMRNFQRTKQDQFPFPFKPFLREVRDYVQNTLGKPEIRFKPKALRLLHQNYMNDAVELTTDITEHAEMNGRVEPVESDATAAIKLSLLRHGFHVAPACRRSVESGRRYDHYPLTALKKTVGCTKRATTNSNKLNLLEKANSHEELRKKCVDAGISLAAASSSTTTHPSFIYQKLL